MARMICPVLAVLSLAAIGAAPAAADYNTFDSETLNDVNAFGQEIPYTGGAARVFVTSTFDNTSFTLQPGEGDAGPGNLNGCAKTPAVYGGKTAWVRFNPGVDGRIYVLAQTPGYDSIVWIREAREAPWKTASFSDVQGRDNNCGDDRPGVGEEQTYFPYVPGQAPARANLVYYAMVAVKCPTPTDRTSCADPWPGGGPTTIRLTFTPDDSDSDGVPDTQDACPGSGVRGSVTGDGCPDTDQDGIRDDQEGPGCVGQKGVPAPAPYNGCPDGPNPPSAGLPGMVIKSKSGDADNTSSVNVDLYLNWPKGARGAVASNGVSLGDEVPIPLQAKVPWRLRPTTKSETRQVKVTFLGPGIERTVEDIITLDREAPAVTKYFLARSRSSQWYLGVNAADDRDGSGVKRLEVLDSRQRRIRQVVVCTVSSRCRRQVGRALGLLPRKPRYLRVTDAAGNSRRKPLAAAAGCVIKVWITATPDPTDRKCFLPGFRCTARGYAWGDAHPRLSCTRGRVRRR